MVALSKTQKDLEWSRIVEAVAKRCKTPLAENLDHLPIAANRNEANELLKQTAEALTLIEVDDALPLRGVHDVSTLLDRIEKQGAGSGPELRALSVTLGAARVLRRFLSRRREQTPTLHAHCPFDPTLDRLQEKLDESIEADGTLSDSASPQLRSLRTEVANLRARIIGRLESMIHKHADIIQDRFHTLREDRYVLPVRTDAHEKLDGIVHATSQSGATVFVEPKAIIKQGNRLKVAKAELDREEARILGLLSESARNELASIRTALDSLYKADLHHASAQLTRDLKGSIVTLEAAPILALRNARHPLLVLDKVDVIANDLHVEGGQALVFSGPNAGGKTVSLKLLGLCALMARSGIGVPAQEGSRAGFFGSVMTDVGDEQSLSKNLSTFSAHVKNLGHMLDTADNTSLILVDEIATGTDPGEGAALAQAILEDLTERGCAVAVTTHYEALKACAVEQEQFRNASVGFNVERMQPTFRIRLDVPGASSALAVAERFGLKASVLDRARDALPAHNRSFEDLLKNLTARFGALDEELLQAENARRESESLRTELQAKLEEATQRDKHKLSAEAETLMQQIRAARGELKAARKALRKKEKLDNRALDGIRKQLEDASSKTHSVTETVGPTDQPGRKRSEPKHTPVQAQTIRVGDSLWVPHLRTAVEVLESPTKGRIRVAAGAVKMWINVNEARRPGEDAEPPRDASEKSEKAARRNPEKRQTSDNTLDLRGIRVDDALGMVESFLDRLYGANETVAYLLHGHGSGALREAIRDHLARVEHYVHFVRGGTLEEGGERLTVVYLR